MVRILKGGVRLALWFGLRRSRGTVFRLPTVGFKGEEEGILRDPVFLDQKVLVFETEHRAAIAVEDDCRDQHYRHL